MSRVGAEREWPVVPLRAMFRLLLFCATTAAICDAGHAPDSGLDVRSSMERLVRDRMAEFNRTCTPAAVFSQPAIKSSCEQMGEWIGRYSAILSSGRPSMSAFDRPAAPAAPGKLWSFLVLNDAQRQKLLDAAGSALLKALQASIEVIHPRDAPKGARNSITYMRGQKDLEEVYNRLGCHITRIWSPGVCGEIDLEIQARRESPIYKSLAKRYGIEDPDTARQRRKREEAEGMRDLKRRQALSRAPLDCSILANVEESRRLADASPDRWIELSNRCGGAK